MFTKMITKKFYFSMLAVCLLIGSVVLADTIINNYYNVSDKQEETQTVAEPTMGAVAAVGGVCDGSEPATQLCNVNAYDFSSQSGISGATLAVSGASALTGAVSTGNFTQGGGRLNAGISGTATITPTLTQAQLAAYSYIDITASTTATTTSITLPATSTLTTLIPNAGDSKKWIIENANLAVGAVTILAGTGIELIAVTANDDVIDGQEYSELICYRKANTNVVCVTSELLAAD